LVEETEEYIVSLINSTTEWKIPLAKFDLRVIVKDYLDRQGIVDKVF